MSIPKIEHFVLPEHTNTLYDNEAISSISLTKEVAAKINELVEAYNELSKIDLEWKQTQEGTIRKGIVYMKDNLMNSLNDLMNLLLSNGYIGDRISEHTATLAAQLNNLIGKIKEGSTTMDAEVIDGRVGDDGTTYKTIGEAIRTQIHNLNPLLHLYLGVDVNTNTGEVVLNANSSNKISYNILKRKGSGVSVATVDPVKATISYDVSLNRPIAVSINITDGAATLKAEATNTYIPSANDIVMFYVYMGEIIPVSATPQSLYVDGRPYAENPAAFKKNTSSIVGLNANLRIDEENKVFTLEGGYYVFPMYKEGVVFTDEQSLPYGHTSAVEYLVFNAKTLTMYMVDRFHRFLADEFCLGSLYKSDFIPVELNVSNVVRTNNEREVITTQTILTMNEMFKKLGDNNHRTKIVLAGDSITHGVGGRGFAQNGETIITVGGNTYKRNPSGYCWANLFKEFVEGNFNAEVINNGCTGTNSSWWDTHKASLIPSDADIVVLAIGTNDRINTGETKETVLAKYAEHLSSIVEYCHNNGIHIVLCSPIPSATSDEENNRIVNNFHLNSVVQSVAAKYNMEYANMYNEVYYALMFKEKTISEMLSDGLHPGDEMYSLLFNMYLKAFNIAPHYSMID